MADSGQTAWQPNAEVNKPIMIQVVTIYEFGEINELLWGLHTMDKNQVLSAISLCATYSYVFHA